MTVFIKRHNTQHNRKIRHSTIKDSQYKQHKTSSDIRLSVVKCREEVTIPKIMTVYKVSKNSQM